MRISVKELRTRPVMSGSPPKTCSAAERNADHSVGALPTFPMSLGRNAPSAFVLGQRGWLALAFVLGRRKRLAAALAVLILLALCGVFAACGAGESGDGESANLAVSENAGGGSGDLGAAEADGSGAGDLGAAEANGSGAGDLGDAESDGSGAANLGAAGEAAWLFDISTTDIDGNAFDASALRQNKLIVVNLWATWCPPCVAELPALARIQTDYREAGVQIVGVLLDASDSGAIDVANTLLDDAQTTYPSIIPEALLSSNVINAVEYVPTTLLVDANGNILDTIVGSNDYSDWSGVIDAALAHV